MLELNHPTDWQIIFRHPKYRLDSYPGNHTNLESARSHPVIPERTRLLNHEHKPPKWTQEPCDDSCRRATCQQITPAFIIPEYQLKVWVREYVVKKWHVRLCSTDWCTNVDHRCFKADEQAWWYCEYCQDQFAYASFDFG